MKKTVFLILSFIAICNCTFAQKFQAVSSAQEILEGSTFTFEYVMVNLDQNSIQVPKFDYFDIVSGPNTTFSLNSVNGVSKQTQTLSYVLLPKRAGTFVIKAATATRKGKPIRSNLVRIKVLEKKKGKDGKPLEVDGEKVFVKAEISHDTCFLGQQVYLDYVIYYSVSVENYNMMNEPEYDGFFTTGIRAGRARKEQVVINNKQYYKQSLKRMALYPQQTGILNIEESKFRIGISKGDPNRKRSIWSSPRVNYTFINSNAIDITVLDLPADPPASFSGAVGSFRASSIVNPKTLTTDDAFTIIMNITGDGDVKHIRAPEINLHPNLELYDKKLLEDNVQQKSNKLVSSVKIEYQVLPKKPGRYTIQPEFSYFDPDSLKYFTKMTGRYSVTVIQGTQKKSDKVVVSESDAMSSHLRAIKTSTSLQSGRSSFRSSSAFLLLSIMPIFLFLGAIGYKQVQLNKGEIDYEALRKEQASKVASSKLEKAKQFMVAKESRSFFDEISKALLGYANDKLQISNADMSKDLVASTLKENGVSEGLIDQLLNVLRKSEMALFGGQADADTLSETYDNATKVIVSIEDELGKGEVPSS